MSTDPRDSVAGNYQQVYGYGTPPPQGYGRPQRGGMPPWAKVVIIVVALVMGGCAALVGFGYYALRSAGVIANVPRAKVITGTAIQWQTLAQWKAGGMFSGGMGMGGPWLFAGNFDKDAGPELLLVHTPAINPLNPTAPGANAAPLSIFELDGSERKLSIGNTPYIFWAAAWDYDGDGVLEIVTAGSGTEVYDTSGGLLTTLSGTYNYSGGDYTVDVDGDGHDELLLQDPMNSGATVATGLKGKTVWNTSIQGYGGAWGNIDTDKYAEYVDPYGAQGGGPQGTDMKGKVTPLTGWSVSRSLNSGNFGVEQLCCVDLDGDGIDEVVHPFAGYLNPKSNKYTALSRPIRQQALQSGMPGVSTPGAVAGDFDGDGQRELAVTDSAGKPSFTTNSAGTALVIYRADGSVQYYEEFGRNLNGIAVVHDGKGARLAVLLSDRLLLAP